MHVGVPVDVVKLHQRASARGGAGAPVCAVYAHRHIHAGALQQQVSARGSAGVHVGVLADTYMLHQQTLARGGNAMHSCLAAYACWYACGNAHAVPGCGWLWLRSCQCGFVMIVYDGRVAAGSKHCC